ETRTTCLRLRGRSMRELNERDLKKRRKRAKVEDQRRESGGCSLKKRRPLLEDEGGIAAQGRENRRCWWSNKPLPAATCVVRLLRRDKKETKLVEREAC
ncbi:hypothetical protein PIB30_052069, partial [Stylosanthes scabra]|nr:hypothetical protein [Stylosanthes scabra]